MFPDSLDKLTIRRLACEAHCDPRTLQRELDEPGSVKGLVGDRIRRVLAERPARPQGASHSEVGAA